MVQGWYEQIGCEQTPLISLAHARRIRPDSFQQTFWAEISAAVWRAR